MGTPDKCHGYNILIGSIHSRRYTGSNGSADGELIYKI